LLFEKTCSPPSAVNVHQLDPFDALTFCKNSEKVIYAIIVRREDIGEEEIGGVDEFEVDFPCLDAAV
jgi:hypothetical protein